MSSQRSFFIFLPPEGQTFIFWMSAKQPKACVVWPGPRHLSRECSSPRPSSLAPEGAPATVGTQLHRRCFQTGPCEEMKARSWPHGSQRSPTVQYRPPGEPKPVVGPPWASQFYPVSTLLSSLFSGTYNNHAHLLFSPVPQGLKSHQGAHSFERLLVIGWALHTINSACV